MSIRRSIAAVAVAALAAGVLVAATGAPAGADTALVDYTCDLPPAGGLFASQIPDTMAADDLEVTIVDTPDPVVAGHPVHYDIDLPVLDLSEGFPPAPPEIGSYGILRLKYLELTATIPAGLGSVTAAFEQQPAPSWATVSVAAGAVKVRVQSPVSGSYIEVNPDVTPATVRIQTAPGVWSDLTQIPPVDVDGIATGAAGTSIQWRPPTLATQVKYSKQVGPFGSLLNVNWNDANVPCTPNDPNQVVVSTLIEAPAPALSVTTGVAEASVEAGETIHHSVTVANTGNVGLTGVTVTAGPAGCTGTVGALAVGASTELTCSRATVLGEVGELAVTATADSAETAPVTSSPAVTEVRALPAPTVGLVATETVVEPGATVHVTLSVTNGAAVLGLSGLTVTSSTLDCDAPPATLAAGQMATLACTHEATVADVGSFAASVTVDSAETAPVTAGPVAVTVDPVPAPLVTLTRDPGQATVAPGATVTYTLTVDEQGLVPLSDLTAVGTGADCDLVAGTCTHQTHSWDTGVHEASVTVDAAEIDPVTATAEPTAIAVPAAGFTDVAVDAPDAGAVDYARWAGLDDGLAGNRFRPTTAVSRAQVSGMVWGLVGRPAAPVRTYADVAAANRYRPAIDWVVARTLLTRASGNRFLPNGTIDRCGFVRLAWRLAGAPTGAPASGFSDVAASSPCRRAAAWAEAHGLLAGTVTGARFRPTTTVSRVEAVRVLALLAGAEAAWGSGAMASPAQPRFDPTD